MLPKQLIKLGFYLLYNQMAWSYDTVALLVSFGQWPAWRRLSMEYLQPGPILELAYGTGGLYVDLLAAGHTPVGIERSPYMARITRKKIIRQNQIFRLNQANAQALPFPDHHFANVVATFPTNYIFEMQTLVEINRVLQSPGRLIIVVEGYLRGPQPLRPVIEWLYWITDQRGYPKGNPLDKLSGFGFSAGWQRMEHQGASARLIVAQK